jgi:uncharacterized protein (TIGR02996 family)
VTTTRDDLLRAVLAEPDDDAPRLVLADWLEEYGDDADRARAAFIRVQCELARRESLSIPLHRGSGPATDIVFAPKPRLNPDYAENLQRMRLLRRRERELLGAWQGRWTCDMLDLLPCLHRSPLFQMVARDASRVGRWPSDDAMFRFRRGFVEVVGLDAAAWLRHADALLAAAPLREVRLTGRLGARCWVDPSYGPLGVLTADDPTADMPLREVSRTVAYPNRSDAPPVEQLLAVLWPGVRFVLPTT